MISIIIPALDEIAALPANLSAIKQLSGKFEVIVVDGGSRDGTIECVLQQDDTRIRLAHSPAGRGRQMNAGAAHACGEWLLFHHADSLLPADALTAIERLPAAVQWGGFTHQFWPSNWRLRVISALHNFRWRRTGVVYGDQSMFVRRSFFEQIGGFAEQGIEDLIFSDQARALAPSHLLPMKVRTDSRKFTQLGEFRTLLQVLSIIRRYEKARAVGHETFFLPYR